MNKQKSIEELRKAAIDIAESMTLVATNIALLGTDGNADVQAQIITDENNKVLDRIRELYNLPPATER